ncbi:MAG: hypothetical protein MRY78_11790 [Saprospiraceae bacterium]|nr:hypothetical protein [Saprospiraceae bacterium]
MRLRPIEIFLIQLVFYILLWLIDDYVAVYISLIFACICLFIFLIALAVELVERSRVPRSYYSVMLLSILAPVLASLLMLAIFGQPSWMEL